MALQRDAERIIQLQYLLQVSLRTSENPLRPKFGQTVRIPLRSARARGGTSRIHSLRRVLWGLCCTREGTRARPHSPYPNPRTTAAQPADRLKRWFRGLRGTAAKANRRQEPHRYRVFAPRRSGARSGRGAPSVWGFGFRKCPVYGFFRRPWRVAGPRARGAAWCIIRVWARCRP